MMSAFDRIPSWLLHPMARRSLVLSIGALGLALMIASGTAARARQTRDLELFLNQRQSDLAEAFEMENHLRIRQILRDAPLVGVRAVTFADIATREILFSFPTEVERADGLGSRAIRFTHYGLALGEIRYAPSWSWLFRNAVLSPGMILMWIALTVFAILNAVLPIRRYQALVENILKTVEAWSSGDLSFGANAVTTDPLLLRIENGFREAIAKQIQAEEKVQRMNYNSRLGMAVRQVGHDLGSPLAAAQMTGATLPDGWPMRKVHLGALERMEGILNQLREKARSETNRKPTRSVAERADLGTVLSQVIAEKRAEYSQSPGLVFEYHEPAVSVRVIADHNQLSRVLSNILNNAVAAARRNEVSQNQRVGVRVEALRGETVSIIISDSGPGLSEAERRWFNLGVFRGGYGLPHASQWMERWGGTMRFGADAGGGTEVSLSFQRIGSELTLESLPDAVRSAKKIVLVDDDPFVHSTWRMQCRDKELVVVDSAARFFASVEALATADIHVFDYNLGRNSPNGLDLVARSGLARRSVLITGEEPGSEAYVRAREMGIPVVSKAQFSRVWG